MTVAVKPLSESRRRIGILQPGAQRLAGGAFAGKAGKQFQPALMTPRPVKIGPARKLRLRVSQSPPASTVEDEQRCGESRPVLAARALDEKRARHRIECVHKIDEHGTRRELAGIKSDVAVVDAEFSADARFVLPPQMRGIAAAEIDDGLYSMGTQKPREKSGPGLRPARCLAGLHPVKIVRKIKEHVLPFTEVNAGPKCLQAKGDALF